MPGPGDRDHPDDDDLIGFSTPASLHGRPREIQLSPEVAPAPAPQAASEPQRRTRRPQSLNTLTLYALILFTVPTLGLAGLIGLLAVRGRLEPDDALERSHFIYQKRTLLAGGAAAIAGIVLLAAPFALGVTLLFALAVWLLVRGASGVWTLKAGRPIANPKSWWI